MLQQSEQLLKTTEKGEKVRVALRLEQEATWADAAVHQLMLAGVKGDVTAIREMADRIEGRAPTRMEITTQPKTEVTFEVVFRKTIQTPTPEE